MPGNPIQVRPLREPRRADRLKDAGDPLERDVNHPAMAVQSVYEEKQNRRIQPTDGRRVYEDETKIVKGTSRAIIARAARASRSQHHRGGEGGRERTKRRETKSERQ